MKNQEIKEYNTKGVKEDNRVFYISVVVIGILSLLAMFFNQAFSTGVQRSFTYLTSHFGYLYFITIFIFIVFCLYMAFSKYGKIKLGGDLDKPEYSYLSWFSMLFCAGMGSGVLFWGVAEPVQHYLNPINVLEPASVESANFAIRASFYHWGIQVWASYIIIGLPLAYFQFRKKKQGLISGLLEPILGNRVHGNLGILIDCLAVFATLAGIATSLGFGTMQLNSGLNYLYGLPNNTLIQMCILAVTTIIFIMSSNSGIGKGIKKLSNFNIVLAFLLLGYAFINGPTVAIIENFFNGIRDYARNILPDSLNMGVSSTDGDWVSNWSIFYLAWAIAWAPFVGIFIARISKGRTIREFIIGVLIAPTITTFLFFATFGTMAIDLSQSGTVDIEAFKLMVEDVSLALFTVTGEYNFTIIISSIMMFLLLTFFVTSADSATFVLGMLISKGSLNPSNVKKMILGILLGVLAAALLVTGGLEALRTASIIAAFPFIPIMLLIILSFLKEIRKESFDKKDKLNEK